MGFSCGVAAWEVGVSEWRGWMRTARLRRSANEKGILALDCLEI
jgi:hypothetical protein